MPTIQPDMVITNSKGELIATIEIKNMTDLSRQEAAEIRKDLLEYGLPDQAPYFLLLSQDTGFLTPLSRYWFSMEENWLRVS